MTSPYASVAPSESPRSDAFEQDLPIVIADRLEDEVAHEFDYGRFGNDGSGDGPGREFKAQGLKRKDGYDPKATQTANDDKSLTGLDTRGNVLLNTFVQKADADFLKAVQASHGLKRDVDWRDDVMKPCATQARKRACIVQQAGKRAKEGEECRSCGNGHGPFKSCRVLTYGDQILFNGACGNCGFNSGGNKCSLREEGEELAGWVKAYLKKANPLHQLVREKVPKKGRGSATPVAGRTRSSETEKKGKSKKEESSDGESEDEAPKAGPSGTKEKQAAKGKAPAKEAPKPKAKAKGKAKKYFENDWMSSPLNDPGVVNKADFTRAAEAYDAIPEMMEALEEARKALKGWLVDNGQLSEDEDEKEEEEEDDDPFEAYLGKKRKRA